MNRLSIVSAFVITLVAGCGAPSFTTGDAAVTVDMGGPVVTDAFVLPDGASFVDDGQACAPVDGKYCRDGSTCVNGTCVRTAPVVDMGKQFHSCEEVNTCGPDTYCDHNTGRCLPAPVDMQMSKPDMSEQPAPPDMAKLTCVQVDNCGPGTRCDANSGKCVIDAPADAGAPADMVAANDLTPAADLAKAADLTNLPSPDLASQPDISPPDAGVVDQGANSPDLASQPDLIPAADLIQAADLIPAPDMTLTLQQIQQQCNDGRQDNDETDIDCAGVCAQIGWLCWPTKHCKANGDCVDPLNAQGVVVTCEAIDKNTKIGTCTCPQGMNAVFDVQRRVWTCK